MITKRQLGSTIQISHKLLRIYSDNGSNFQGARNELKVLVYDFLNKSRDETQRFCPIESISWHFIPPYCNVLFLDVTF